MGALSRLHERYERDVAFLVVYVREAHPEDGWVLADNRRDGVRVRDPAFNEDRADVATTCVTRFALAIPMVVDGVDDEVARQYGAWPDRLYLIDVEGRIAYQGGPGPFGFVVAELEAAIEHELAARTST